MSEFGLVAGARSSVHYFESEGVMSSRKEQRLASQGRFSEAKDAKKSKKREREAVEKEVVEVEVDIDSDDVDDDDKGTILRPTKKRGTDSTKMGQGYVNKQRVLIIASRGITARHRYFLDDLRNYPSQTGQQIGLQGRH